MYPVIFAHGLESSPKGTKASYLRERFGAVSPELGKLSLEGQVDALEDELVSRDKNVLVGSSLGGLAAIGAAHKAADSIAHLVLLAPAVSAWRHRDVFKDAERIRPGLREKALELSRLSIPESTPCTIIHGFEDDVVYCEDVVGLAARSPSARLILVHDDHPLRRSASLILSVVDQVANSRDPIVVS